MRILIANPFGLGDVLFTLPLLQAIRFQKPSAFIGYLCNRRTDELTALFPELDCHRPFELRSTWRRSKKEGWREAHDSIQWIKEKKIEILLDLSLGWHAGFVAWAAGVPDRIGFDYRHRGRFLTQRIPLEGFHREPIPEEYLDLLPGIGLQRPLRLRLKEASPGASALRPGLRLNLPSQSASLSEEHLRSLGIEAGEGILGMVPGGGASWGANARFKQWAPERFAKIGNQLAERHGLRPLLLGEAEEAPLLKEVSSRMSGRPVTLAPAPSLLLLAGILQRCRLVVGNDSGPMHLACAVGTRTLSIFGPVDASVYGPYPRTEEERFHRVALRGLACRPCYQNFRFPPCPWDRACLSGLSTDTVFQEADELLRLS